MRGINDLRPKQRPAVEFLYQGDQSLLLADVGTGKTIMTLTVLDDWVRDGICDGALILAPKNVCINTWATEQDDWDHIKALDIGILAGRSAAQRQRMIDSGDHNVLVINYEMLPWLMNEYVDGIPGFNVLVCDEIDKCKEHSTQRFKGTPRRVIRRDGERVVFPKTIGLKDWRQNFDTIIGMTGTPTPSKLLELWAQVYIIDGGKRLGTSYYDYRNMHFYQSDWAGYDYEPLPGREQFIYEQIADITYRIAATPGVDTPHVIELPPRWLELPAKTRAIYKELERNYIVELKRKLAAPGAETATIDASDGAAVLYGKLRQISQGFAYVDEELAKVGEWLFYDKFAELDSLISELQGQQLMIVYHFVEQMQELKRRYGARFAFLGGGLTDAQSRDTIDNWNSGRLELLGAQPQSAGHGLNLMKSGAHHVMLLTLPETAGLVEQVVGRLARSGNPSGEVYVHRILMRGTVDEERNGVVNGKITTQQAFLNSMEARQ